jgi:hypothetical protein
MNWIEKQVRKTGLKRVIWALVVGFILFVVVSSQMRYLTCFFKGPQAITKEQLDQVRNPEDLQRYWVTLTTEGMIDGQFQEITVTKNHGIETGRSVTANYYLARVGDRLLAVKAHNGMPGLALSGALLRSTNKVDDEFLHSATVRAHAAEVYPSMVLDTEDFRSAGSIGMAIGVAVLALVGWLAWTGISWISKPKEHKLVKLVQSWGDADKIAARLELELKSSQAIKLGNVVFTQNFVVQRNSYNFKLLRTDQLIWVYQRITKQKTYFITTGKTHALSINTEKESLLINGKEKLVAQVMQQLATQKPWIIFGYSEDLKKYYQSKRAQMVKDVIARREKALAATKAA